MDEYILVKCTLCGTRTDWEADLGDPVCVRCWDNDNKPDKRRRRVSTKLLTPQQRYYQAHKEHIIARSKARYHANIEGERAKRAEYHRRNKDKDAARKHQWYLRNRKRLLVKRREYHATHKTRIAARMKLWSVRRYLRLRHTA